MSQKPQISRWMQHGQGLSEYGLMIAGIGMVLIIALAVLQDDLRTAIRQSVCGVGNYEYSEGECAAYVANNDELPDSVAPDNSSSNGIPTARITPPSTCKVNTACQFSGTNSSDPEGDPLTYAWTASGGTLSNPSSANPKVTYSSTGTKTVELVVSDGNGNSNSTARAITVTSANGAPTARISLPVSCTAGTACSFDGSTSTDPNNDSLTYSWSTANDGTITNGSSVTASITFASSGTKSITLTVSDGTLTGTKTETITVSAGSGSNTPPTVSITPPSGGCEVGTGCTFGSSASDPDGDALTYSWSATNGSVANATGVSTSITFSASGSQTVSLTVNDGNGGSKTANVTITVSSSGAGGGGNTAPTAAISAPATCQVNTNCSFNGGGSSDPDGDTLSYSWDFGDGFTSTNQNPSHIYSNAGLYTVKLTVNDGQATSSATKSIEITEPNSIPLADVTGPAQCIVNQSCTGFDGSESYDPDAGDTIASYSWNLQGGTASNSNGSTTAITFTSTGSKTVTLQVTDNHGATSDLNDPNARLTVNVISGNQAPTARINPGVATCTVGQACGLYDGSTSSDPDGDALSYTWTATNASVAAPNGKSTTVTFNQTGSQTVSLVVNDGQLNSSKVNYAVTVQALKTHIDNLTSSAQSTGGNNWTMTVVIRIVDNNGNPVSNVNVGGAYRKNDSTSGSSIDTKSCTTGANGECSVTSVAVSSGGSPSSRITRMTFTVDSVTKSGTTYDSAANTKTSVSQNSP